MPINADTYQLGPWNGGVRYDLAVEDVPNNALSAMDSTQLTPGGAVERRLGTASYGSAAAISGTPTLTVCGELILPGAAAVVFITAGDKLYEYDSGWTDRTGTATITAGDDNTFEWAKAYDTLVATNGVDTDAITWAGAGQDAAALDDDGRFTKGKHIAFWDNRLWIGNENSNNDRVWYSDTGDITTWGATNFHQYGSPVTGLESMQNSLAVHTEDGIHVVMPTGNSTVPYQLQQRTGVGGNDPQRGGTLSGRAIVTIPGNIQIFPLRDGFYAWSGGNTIEKVSHALDLGFWDGVNEDRLLQSFGVYYPAQNAVWFWIPADTGQTNMNHIICMSTKLKYQDEATGEIRNAWFGPFHGATTTFERNCAAIIDGTPHAGTFGGKLLDHAPASTYNDETAAYDSHFETGAKAPYGPDVDLRWLYARVYYDAVGEHDISWVQQSQGVGLVSGTFETTGGGGTLGSFELDVDELGTVRMVSRDIDLNGYDPHSSLKFSNNAADEPYRIRRVPELYKVIGRHRKQKTGVT